MSARKVRSAAARSAAARSAAALAGLVLAVATAGCGIIGSGHAAGPDGAAGAAGPATTAGAGAPRRTVSHSDAPTAAAIARARTTHELPTPAARPRVLGGWPSPGQAIREFATTYVNWSAATIAGRLRALEGVSVGQARALLAQTAGEVGRDTELRAGEIANSGTVEGIAPLRGRRYVYAVVTRERTSAARDAAYDGLRPAWHVALATVTRIGGLWVLSRWDPES